MRPKLSRRHLAWGGVTLLLVIPIVMAAIAPLLAPIHTQAGGWVATPLPVRDTPLPGFQHLLEPLPVFVRDLPDAESQRAVAAYDGARFPDHQSNLDLLEASISAVPVLADQSQAWHAWLAEMMDRTERRDPVPIPAGILADLATDPRNGDRLNNLAVSMFLAEISMPVGEDNPSYLLGTLTPVKARVQALMQTIRSVFPQNRSLTLNLVAVFAGSSDVLHGWLSSHPEDATALLLLVRDYRDLVSYHGFAEPITDFLTPLTQSDDPVLAALGHALLGDTIMLAAPDQPYAARQSALRALQEYDRALELADDPSVYIARAFALERIGDIHSAIETQQRALELAPDSVTSRIRLAHLLLQRRDGDEQGLIETVEAARSLSQQAVSLVDYSTGMRLTDIELRWSEGDQMDGYALLRPERYFFVLGPVSGGRGAGMIVSFDSIPVVRTIPIPIDPDSTGAYTKTPVTWAAGYAAVSSVALGDPATVSEDLEKLRIATNSFIWYFDDSWWGQQALTAAKIVADPVRTPGENLDYYATSLAIDSMRYAGLSERSLSVCSTLLEQPAGRRDELPALLGTCVAENAYLTGDLERSKETFEDIGNTLMTGYVAERQGNLEAAETHYRQAIAAGGDESFLAMGRLADMTLEQHPDEAIASYDQVIKWLIDPDRCSEACFEARQKLPLFYSNRGVARLNQLALNHGRIACDEDGWESCTAAFMDFNTALEADPYNPVFLMNQAWVARLLGDTALARDLMDRAATVDATLYPVLNDLGVFAELAGDSNAARGYFLDAVAANPEYDLALWNLGVLHMREGIGGLLRGQAYLARAVVQSPSLITGSMELLTDERIYRVEIDERNRPGSTWTFGATSSFAASGFAFLSLVMLALKETTRTIGFGQLEDTLRVRMHTVVERVARYAPQRLQSTRHSHTMNWLSMAAGLVVLFFTTAWLARAGDPGAAAASVALALFAVVLAAVVHSAGHAIVAGHVRASIQSTQWVPGSILAFLLLPLGLSSGPFPSQTITSKDDKSSSKVYLAGPASNLIVALIFYLVFMMQPMPFLRLIAQVQLVAMCYALLPFAPHDGSAINRDHPTLLRVLSATGLLLGVLLSLGIL